MVVADLVAVIINDYKLKGQKSTKQVEASFRHIVKHFGENFPAEDLTYDRLLEYSSVRLETCARDTVRRELAFLGRSLRLMLRSGRIRLVPQFPEIRKSDPREGWFEEVELEAVCAEMPEDLEPLMWFLFLTGWRVSEGRGLTWANVDFKEGTVWLERKSSKNRRGRFFPFSILPELRELLEGQQKATEELQARHGIITPWVFWKAKATKRLRPGRQIAEFAKMFARVAIRAGLPGRVVHDLRRTAFRNLIRAGVPLHTAMLVTGHRSMDVAIRYDIVAERDVWDAVEKLARAREQKNNQGHGL